MVKIAVLTNKDGMTSTLFEADIISIFEKVSDQWESVAEFLLDIDSKAGIHALRQSLAGLSANLEGCSAIVGREVSGIPYNILDTAGFSIFEIEGTPAEFLEAVYEMLQASQVSEPSTDENHQISMEPVETDIEGNYWINLTEAQKCNPSMSSKKVLIPFLRNTAFHQLEVICSHIPPWFESELPRYRLNSTAERLGVNEYKVTICHMTCDEVSDA